MKKKLVSIIVPVLNEEANIRELVNAIVNIFQKELTNFNYEIIFTDNDSKDNTVSIIKELIQYNKCIKLIKFSNNFGLQNSILTGVSYAKGDAVIQIDCDLQDPPDLIKDFVIAWYEHGYDVVSGARKNRSDNFIMNLFIKFYYRLINLIEPNQKRDVGDFRLISKKVVDELIKFECEDIYLRGVVAKIGFKHKLIPYKRQKRYGGKSKFNFFKLADFALDGITSVSYKPIKVVSYFSFLFLIISVIIFVFFLTKKIFYPDNQPLGFATLISVLMIFFGINCLIFSVFGQYLIRISKQTSRGPRVIIEEKININ